MQHCFRQNETCIIIRWHHLIASSHDLTWWCHPEKCDITLMMTSCWCHMTPGSASWNTPHSTSPAPSQWSGQAYIFHLWERCHKKCQQTSPLRENVHKLSVKEPVPITLLSSQVLLQVCKRWHNLFAKKQTSQWHFLVLNKITCLKLIEFVHLQCLSKCSQAGRGDCGIKVIKRNVAKNYKI